LDMAKIFGAEFRRVENREYLGRAVLVAVAIRTYDTTVEDLWEAITTRERVARWFLPVEGELKLGGRYQLVGNAGGTITHCEPPKSFELTWEIMGGTSWVHVHLTPEGKKARLTLEHLAPKDGIGEEHLKRFGPGAVGVGWDLTLYGLELHLANPTAPRDAEAIDAWTKSTEGLAFMRASGEAWGAAHAASGDDPQEARASAERTIAFYTGS
jgi:uncharacterized protein YndB with AHSA1/START domain